MGIKHHQMECLMIFSNIMAINITLLPFMSLKLSLQKIQEIIFKNLTNVNLLIILHFLKILSNSELLQKTPLLMESVK